MLDQAIFDTQNYVIDIFPLQIPSQRSRAFFAAEKFFLQEPQLHLIRQKFARMIVMLGCYYDIVLEHNNQQQENPSPEIVFNTITNCKSNDYLTFFLPQQNSAITYSGDDLYMTLYNPDDTLANLLAQICGTAGLFLRR